MASYTATVETAWDAETAFAYLAEFSNVADWDPSIPAARHLGGNPQAPGARYEVDVEIFGRTTTMPYESVAAEPPHRVVLRSDSGRLVSVDTLSFDSLPSGGTRVTYDADLTLKGALKLLDPALQLAFNRTGAKARDGLAARLSGLPPANRGSGS
jgi:hypothetical protein